MKFIICKGYKLALKSLEIGAEGKLKNLQPVSSETAKKGKTLLHK